MRPERKEFEEMLKTKCSREGFSNVTFLTRMRGEEGTAKAFRLAGRRGKLVWTGVTVGTFIARTWRSQSLHKAEKVASAVVPRLPTLPSTLLFCGYLWKKVICTRSLRLSK